MVNPIIDDNWLQIQIASIHWHREEYIENLEVFRTLVAKLRNLPVCKKSDCPESEWC
jgi:hypothetical protein